MGDAKNPSAIKPGREGAGHHAEPSGPVTPGNGHPIVRDRLGALRDDLLRQLANADHLDAGLLRVLADVEIVLARLDFTTR